MFGELIKIKFKFSKRFFSRIYIKHLKFFKGFFYLEIILTVLCQKQIIFFWQIKLREFLIKSCSENRAVAIIIFTSKYYNSKIVCYLFILHICFNPNFFFPLFFPLLLFFIDICLFEKQQLKWNHLVPIIIEPSKIVVQHIRKKN